MSAREFGDLTTHSLLSNYRSLLNIGVVSSVGFYHGGDELYVIEGIPGVWHEVCLSLAEKSK